MRGSRKSKKQAKPLPQIEEREEDEEDEEVFLQQTKQIDGKWGWFVVLNSFFCNMIVDGMQYTFANLLNPITATFNETTTRVALIGSLLSGFYNFSGPIAGALGNKFGFRMVAMTGSVIASAGLMLSYFAKGVTYLYFFYGFLGGLGFGMIYMASVITASVYFEKYRALAVSLCVCGTGVGTFVFAPLGNWMVMSYGWNWTLVIEGGVLLLCIIFGWSFKPLKLISVIPVQKEPSRVSSGTSRAFRHGSIFYPPEPKKGLTNEDYPTFKKALNLEEDDYVGVNFPKSRRATMDSVYTPGPLPIFSVVPSLENIENVIPDTKKKKVQKCCRVCCFNFWHCQCKKHDLTLGDRPMYRDDIFYGGSLTKLNDYKSQDRLNYHLSITRIPNQREIQEHVQQKCCLCHHAFLRTCVTMTGVNLFKSIVFTFLCVSSFLYTMALYIPYMFILELANQNNISEETSVWLVSAIGISNTAGRLCSGIVKSFFKVNAALFVLICLAISGLYSLVFFFWHDLTCFISFSLIYGFFTAPFISLRPVIIVDFLGIEKLTNAFGLVLLTQGVASIIGPPLAGILQGRTGQTVYVMYLCAGLLLCSALSLLISTAINLAKTKESSGNSKVKDENEDKDEDEDEDEDEEIHEDEEDEKAIHKDLKGENYAIVPPNGGWGWVVVACAFYCNVVVDGIQLTFGIFLKTLSQSLKAEYSLVALAGALIFGVHLIAGPVCAGFSNIFGLRPVTIIGSLICSFGIGITYFAKTYWYLYITYGFVGGLGLGLVYMNSLVITSLYFTTLLPVAAAIVVCGTGVGTIIFAGLSHTLLQVTTWKMSFLMQSLLAASMGLAAISFKPLKPYKVEIRGEKPKRSKKSALYIKKEISLKPSSTSINTLQSLAWNSLLDEVNIRELRRKKCCPCNKRRKSDGDTRVLVLTKNKAKEPHFRKSYVEEKDVEESSASDSKVFYTKIVYEHKQETKFWQPLKNTLKLVLDCRLLGSLSFFLFTISGSLQITALVVVFIYEKERCADLGFTEEMSMYFIMTLGASNMIWRLLLGVLASIPKINYRALAISCAMIGGIATSVSGLHNSVGYQFAFCVFFGLGTACFAVFRLILLIDLVGINLIGNATGINLLFMGIFSIVCPPIFGWAMEKTKNYNVIFITTGVLTVISSLMLIGLQKLRQKELEKGKR